MSPSARILEIIAVRFLMRPAKQLTWQVSPKAAGWLRARGVAVSEALLVAPPDDWRLYRDLRNCEKEVHDRHEYFADVVRDLVTRLPAEVERYTVSLNPGEYRILLVYAGQEAYDFFARDHRFGPLPRGKVYRSNLRRGYDSMKGRAKRPDVAVFKLERKIAALRAYGGDTTDLETELARRKTALERGLDPMGPAYRAAHAGRERRVATAFEAAEALRTAAVADRVEPREAEGEPPNNVVPFPRFTVAAAERAASPRLLADGHDDDRPVESGIVKPVSPATEEWAE